MVYGCIYLVLGVKLSDEEACCKIYEMTKEEYTDEKTKNIGWISKNYIHKFDGSLGEYPPMCCRENTDIIIGVKISTIWRIRSHCDECPYERRNCNKCFGKTDHGYYDFSSYFEPLVECPFENICHNCFYDNRDDGGTCGRCNYIRENSNWELDRILKKTQEELLDYYDIEGECKIYYVHDDCASCT